MMCTMPLVLPSALLACAGGLQGVPLSYSPRADDVVALVLLCCFFLSSLALGSGKKFLTRQLKDFAHHRDRANLFDTSTAGDVRCQVVLVVQTCVLSGTALFCHFWGLMPELWQHVRPAWLLLLYVVACSLYLFLKWVVYLFLGWVFFDRDTTALYIESYFTLIYYMGFLLFPFVLFLVYFSLPAPYWILIGVLLLVFAKMLLFYKWLKLFLHRFATAFFLILYFCALEIGPCLMFYQGLLQINRLLLIKF